MKADAWEKYAKDLGLSKDQVSELSKILINNDLWKESSELKRVFDVLEVAGWSDYVEYDPGIIRGLDYYTGTVFEAIDIKGGGRAILGGGHYDNLVGDVGGDPMPGVGFAMGDVMISIVLDDYGLMPALSPMANTVMVTVFDEDHALDSYRFAQELRDAGIRTSVYPQAVKLVKQFKYADRMGIGFALVIGPDELTAKQVSIKNLKTREQFSVPSEKLIEELRDLLA